jgi:HSP20 family molecular chaperone IbpA
MTDFPNKWMWAEACEALARAERMHREFFRPVRSASRAPAWEPPVDVLETEHEVLVLMALPGVDPDAVEAVIEGSELRVPLPGGRYSGVHRGMANGCLLITLQKVGVSRG